MALPPKGDPRRPLYLAIRSTRMLAIFFLLFGIFGAAALFIPRGMSSRAQTLITILTLMAYIGPGAAYLVFSIYLKQLRFWAVVGAGARITAASDGCNYYNCHSYCCGVPATEPVHFDVARNYGSGRRSDRSAHLSPGKIVRCNQVHIHG